jgi:hypothetical protein
MTPERLDLLYRSVRKRDAMPDADLVLEAQPHDMEELFRLARLGLWAREHGVPALRGVEKLEEYPGEHIQTDSAAQIAKPALAALPKEWS